VSAVENTDVVDAIPHRDSFAFVQALAKELSEGQIQLPSFPEVALRVQRALNDERCDVGAVERAVSAEPALAMQVMRMANSVALNPTGHQVHDLRSAVGRIGYNMVRAAALSFVLQQLRNAEDLRPLRERMAVLWRRSVVVGSLCKVISVRSKTGSPDAALLLGLLHGIGKLYILTRLNKYPQLLHQVGLAEHILADWHAAVAKTLLENWEMPVEFSSAVAAFEDPGREARGALDLIDILASAHLLADMMPATPSDYLDQIQLAGVVAQSERHWQRMNMTRESCSDVLHEAQGQVLEMRAMFGA
jgi:HD-like signal output (HDOD) protein